MKNRFKLIVLIILVSTNASCLKRTNINLTSQTNKRYELVEITKTNGEKIRVHDCIVQKDSVTGKLTSDERVMIPKEEIISFVAVREHTGKEKTLFVVFASLCAGLLFLNNFVDLGIQ